MVRRNLKWQTHLWTTYSLPIWLPLSTVLTTIQEIRSLWNRSLIYPFRCLFGLCLDCCIPLSTQIKGIDRAINLLIIYFFYQVAGLASGLCAKLIGLIVFRRVPKEWKISAGFISPRASVREDVVQSNCANLWHGFPGHPCRRHNHD